MSELATDFWLANGAPIQPKSEIADYVESQGFLVPKRYDSLNEAIAKTEPGEGLVVRSEHPEEYAGPSGLFDSYFVIPGQDKVRGELDRIICDPVIQSGTKVELLKEKQGNDFNVRLYAQLTGQDHQDFLSKLSFSYWKDAYGANLAVVADDAIPNRYHFLASGSGFRLFGGNWFGAVVNDGGERLRTTHDKEPFLSTTQDQIKKVIEVYEQIRNLPNFNAQNCPLMEFQLDYSKDQLWFLQYHHVRKFVAATDNLDNRDFDPAEGWHRADFVRGAIAQTALAASVCYPSYGLLDDLVKSIPETEPAAIYHVAPSALTEILTRRRQAFVQKTVFERLYDDLAAHHFQRSLWFKPTAAFTFRRENTLGISDEVRKKAIQSIVREERMARVVLDFVSDGLTGFVRLNPDSEQPVYTDY